MGQVAEIMSKIAIFLIRIYRYVLSPWVGNQCRFYPSCSHYGEQVFENFGFFKGMWLTACRLLRCHPWHAGGIDLPPVKQQPKS